MLLFLVQYHLPLSHRFNLDTRKIPNNKPLDHPIGCASIPPFYNCLSNHTTPLNRVPTNRGWHQRDILKNLLRNTNFLPRCLPSSPLLLLPFLRPLPFFTHAPPTQGRKIPCDSKFPSFSKDCVCGRVETALPTSARDDAAAEVQHIDPSSTIAIPAPFSSSPRPLSIPSSSSSTSTSS